MTREPTMSGRRPEPAAASAALASPAALRKLVTDAPNVPPQKWLRQAIVDKKSPGDVLKLLDAKLDGAVSEPLLQEALTIVNEIARLPQQAEVLRAHLNEQRVAALTKKGR
jgi:hypothetical protein